MNTAEFFKCESCGNVVARLVEGGGTLTCCGKAMTKLEAKTGDVGLEKHVPVVAHEGGKLVAKCGEVPHPMTAVHHIVFLALVSERGLEVRYLPAEGAEAKAEFADVAHGVVYAYCNIHGLWKKEF
jgi:superoxide reductase